MHGTQDPISNKCEFANAIGRNIGQENCVAVSFKGGQSADGGLGVDEGACQTMQSKMSALEPTVAVSFLPTNSANAHSLGEAEELSPTLAKGMGESGNRPSVAVAYDGYNQTSHDEVTFPLRTANGSEGDDRTVKVAISISTKQQSLATGIEHVPTIGADDYKEPIAIGIGRDAFNSGANAQMAQSISREVQPPITAKGPGGVCVNGEPRKERT